MLHDTASKDEPDQVEKLIKWQEERIQKRLRGEYESAVVHLSEIIRDNLDAPLTVSAVRVEGAVKTRHGFLESLTKPLMPQGPATTLGDVLHSARSISDRLQQTDIFYPSPALSTRIERAIDPLAPASAVDVVVRAREKGTFAFMTQTQVGQGEGTASVTGHVRNVFGGAEVLEVNVETGTTTRRAFQIGLSKPLSADLKTVGHVGIFGTERNVQSWASCVEGLRGIKASLRRGKNQLAYEYVQRNIGDISEGASIAIREAAGISTKSSATHTFLHDTRDDGMAATRGIYLKFMQELAAGQNRFYKTELETQISRKLFSGLSASIGFRSGLLLPFQPETYFSDRFQLGGPTSLRAFKQSGLGPHSPSSRTPSVDVPISDALGGTAYYALGLSLIGDIPKKSHWPVKLHAWANAGRLDNVDPRQSIDNVREMLNKPSVSAGVGLIYRLDPIRVEVNLGVPLAVSKTDLTRRGLQVGIGIEFL